MLQLGDILNIHGDKIDPVDCITFGSPCQDLSIAGKREGITGKQSSLFNEAIRVISEMKIKTHGNYPKFVIWENVPGVFSSNKGDDFKYVLEQFGKIQQSDISIPRPKNGKWAKAGFVCGNKWSIAWRTFNSEFWGVPQRRRRVAIVLDLTGPCAGKILFERKGLCWNYDKIYKLWKETIGYHEDCIERNNILEKKTNGKGTQISACLYAAYGTKWNGNCGAYTGDNFIVETKTIKTIENKATLNNSYNVIRRLTPLECERLQGFPDDWTNIGQWKDKNGKLRNTTDTIRYKAIGNSIALPQWCWIISRMSEYLSESPKLGSLFDGIGGFPLIWEMIYGEHTALWASEIEDFPIAVTNFHFKEN